MHKKILVVIIKLMLSIGLIGFLFSRVEMDAVWSQLISANTLIIVFAAIVLVGQVLFGALRWQAVHMAIDNPLPFYKAFNIFYIGFFFNQILLSAVGGDAVRIYMTYNNGFGLKPSINGVMLERLAAIIVSALIVAVLTPPILARTDGSIIMWGGVSLFITIIVAIVCMLLFRLLDKLPETTGIWYIVKGIKNLYLDARKVFLQPAHTTVVVAWALAAKINAAAAVYMLAKSIEVDISMFECVALVTPALLVTLLPISIGGWGVREGAMIAALSLAGVSSESALVISLLFGFIMIIASLPGGLMWLYSGVKTKDVNLNQI